MQNIFATNQFTLSKKEYHRYVSHVEHIEATGLSTREESFHKIPLGSKCLPALSVPRIHLKGYIRDDFSLRFTSNSTTLGIAYFRNSTLPVQMISQEIQRFGSPEEAAQYLANYTDLDAMPHPKHFGDDKQAFVYFNEISITTLIFWQYENIIIHLSFVRVSDEKIRRIIQAVEYQTQLWNESEDTVEKLLQCTHYLELMVGLSFRVRPSSTTKPFPIDVHDAEFDVFKNAHSAPSNVYAFANHLENMTEFHKEAYKQKHRCAFCQKFAANQCSRCQKVYYCNQICQKKHYKNHKYICRKSAKKN
jgi:hypothetical protein